MQRVVDSVVGVAKEAVKTVTREAFNNVINTVNGASALVLGLVPGRASIVEGLKGWELRPTFKAPRLPRWMEDGVSSLNFIYDDSDSDADSVSGYESGREEYLSMPPSPSSTMSYHSNSSHLSPLRSRHHHHPRNSTWLQFVRRVFWFFFWPLAFLFPRRNPHRRRVAEGLGFSSPSESGQEYYPASSVPLSRSSSNTSLSRHFSIASHELTKRVTDVLEYVNHLNDNRRRGIIEDLQLLMELTIDRVFETVRSILLSPFNTMGALMDTILGRSNPTPVQATVVETTTLGDTRASPKQRVMRLSEALNMDARTCEDIVTDAGYPFEAIKVTTKDGYVLTLERIPRRDSRKVVLLQHGILDSSIGWVSNGVVGSQAFAAYDQGFDVWLGNMRGYVSREHVDKKISAQEYWRYSVNEHGMFDIGAMVRCIHETKLRELREEEVGEEEKKESSDAEQPYQLSAVAHSLGGAAVMLYLATQCMKEEPHRFSRVILLSPAGFHEKTPVLFAFLRAIVPIIDPFMERFAPGFFIPTRGLRLLFNKLAQDFQNLPAVRALVQVVISSFFVGGDSSDWVGALRQPHYNMYDMPGLSYRVMKHMSQMKGAKRFIMYDYGSERKNMAVYGQPQPIDIGAHYHLIDIPVDVVMGRKDNLIPTSMVKKHYQILKAAGRPSSIKEFEYAHLDFTFAQQQDLLAYVMARLNISTTKGNTVVGRENKIPPMLIVRSSLSPDGPVRRVASASPTAIFRNGENTSRKISRTSSAPINGISNSHSNGKKPGLGSQGNGIPVSEGPTGEEGGTLDENGFETTSNGSSNVALNGFNHNGNHYGQIPENDGDPLNSKGPVIRHTNSLPSMNGKKKFRSRVTEIEEVEDDDDVSFGGNGNKLWRREASLSSANGADEIFVQVTEVRQQAEQSFLNGEGLRKRV